MIYAYDFNVTIHKSNETMITNRTLFNIGHKYWKKKM
jgi:hypothetical protein